MPSKTIPCKITAKIIQEATDRAKTGLASGDTVIYADSSTPGLQIRVQGKRAFWAVKYGDFTKTIGFVYAAKEPHRLLPSVTEARDLAAEAKKVLDDDPRKFDSFLSLFYNLPKDEKSGHHDPEEARRLARGLVTTWTLRQCFEFMIEDRQRPGAEEPVKKGRSGSLQEWDLTLRRPAMQAVLDMPAAILTRGDFDDVRKEMLKIGIEPTNKAMSNVRTCLSYCLKWAPGKSGLDEKNQWWLLLARGGKSNTRDRSPTVDDIVRVLLLAEEYLEKPLPGRTDAKHGIGANVFAALWWLMLTAQRTYAALHLERVKLFPDTSPESPGIGWYLAVWPEDVMKAGKEHVIPIPPRVVQHMLPLIAAAKNNDSIWAFPSSEGNSEKDITVNESSVRLFMRRLAARDTLAMDKKGKRKSGFVDFFEVFNIPWWTPHDIRNSIGKELDRAGIPGGSSVILAHKITLPKGSQPDRRRADWLEQFVEDITARAYHDPVRMQLKAKAMLVWTNKILDRYFELKGVNDEFIRERRNGLLASYVASDLHHLQDAIVYARSRYQDDLADARTAVEEDRSTLDEIRKEITSALRITGEMPSRLRIATARLEHSEIALKALESDYAGSILQLAEQFRDDIGIRFDARAVDLKLEQIYRAAGREFLDENRFQPSRDVADYQNLRRQLVIGEISFEELKSEATRMYGLEHPKAETDQATLRQQLADEFGLDFRSDR